MSCSAGCARGDRDFTMPRIKVSRRKYSTPKHGTYSSRLPLLPGIQNRQPDGASGQDGSGCHPGAGRHPGGGGGQPGGD
jgi:hypothetical protein